jgi:RNA ligase (TIGR02306 family)
MSFFGVTLNKIEKAWNHPNADRLDLASLSGCNFQFVVLRDQFKAGDSVLYFPVDSVLPAAVADKLGLTGRLAGKNKDRVKTIKLRGAISQGVVAKPDLFFAEIPEDITVALGVTKYEPPSVPCKAGNLVAMPSGISVYDIEGADRFPHVLEKLMDSLVYISEKIEGTNFWLACKDGSVSFGSRNHMVAPIEGLEHDFIKVAREQGLVEAAQKLASVEFPGKRVVLRGEFCGPGIQGNIYKLPKPEIFIFDILVDDGLSTKGQETGYLDAPEYLALCQKYTIQSVPLLTPIVTLRNWLAGKTVQEASNGKSVLADTLREGIVIKPITEQMVNWAAEGMAEDFGRLFIKQRSPAYLAESDN